MNGPVLDRRALLLAAAGAITAATATRARAHDMAGMAESAPGAPVVTDAIRIDNFAFTPAAIVVPRGMAVTWTNQDDIPHLVVAGDHGFRSPPLDTGDRFSHVYADPGDHPYFCGLHPKMVGTVTVK